MKQANGKGSHWGRCFWDRVLGEGGDKGEEKGRAGKGSGQMEWQMEKPGAERSLRWQKLPEARGATPGEPRSLGDKLSCPVPSALGPWQDRMSELRHNTSQVLDGSELSLVNATLWHPARARSPRP